MSAKRGRKAAVGPVVPVLPVSNKKLEAARALAFFVDIMYNRDLPLNTRMIAAREVLDRVEGKPPQAISGTMEWRSDARQAGVDPSALYSVLLSQARLMLEASAPIDASAQTLDQPNDADTTSTANL